MWFLKACSYCYDTWGVEFGGRRSHESVVGIVHTRTLVALCTKYDKKPHLPACSIGTDGSSVQSLTKETKLYREWPHLVSWYIPAVNERFGEDAEVSS